MCALIDTFFFFFGIFVILEDKSDAGCRWIPNAVLQPARGDVDKISRVNIFVLSNLFRYVAYFT